jgi:hypothetical protein
MSRVLQNYGVRTSNPTRLNYVLDRGESPAMFIQKNLFRTVCGSSILGQNTRCHDRVAWFSSAFASAFSQNPFHLVVPISTVTTALKLCRIKGTLENTLRVVEAVARLRRRRNPRVPSCTHIPSVMSKHEVTFYPHLLHLICRMLPSSGI